MKQEVVSHIQVAHTTEDGNYVVEVLSERQKQLNLGENAIRNPNGIRLFLRADENEGGILEEVHVREYVFNRIHIPIPRFEERVIKAADHMVKLANYYEEMNE